jgi:hypothetical protein
VAQPRAAFDLLTMATARGPATPTEPLRAFPPSGQGLETRQAVQQLAEPQAAAALALLRAGSSQQPQRPQEEPPPQQQQHEDDAGAAMLAVILTERPATGDSGGGGGAPVSVAAYCKRVDLADADLQQPGKVRRLGLGRPAGTRAMGRQKE